MIGDNSYVRMTEWLQLRAAKRRDPAYFVRLRTLIRLRDETSEMVAAPGFYKEGQTQAWKLRAAIALAEILGELHPLTHEIDRLWVYKTPRDSAQGMAWQQQHWREAEGILNAAITSYTFMNTRIEDSTIINTFDRDLIARVDHVFRVEDWTAVASMAATFVEDRFRTWAGLDQSAFGVNLMTKVLHPDTGAFPLGTAAPEREGWHQLGRGFVSACSNVDRHRIQSRDDLRRYAVGVLGTASLLLTQMRYQHGNRFKEE
jgi:hypothetical protein